MARILIAAGIVGASVLGGSSVALASGPIGGLAQTFNPKACVLKPGYNWSVGKIINGKQYIRYGYTSLGNLSGCPDQEKWVLDPRRN